MNDFENNYTEVEETTMENQVTDYTPAVSNSYSTTYEVEEENNHNGLKYGLIGAGCVLAAAAAVKGFKTIKGCYKIYKEQQDKKEEKTQSPVQEPTTEAEIVEIEATEVIEETDTKTKKK